MFFIGLFTILEFLVLAIGLTLGYLLLTMAAKQAGWKATLGVVFAWVLIAYAGIITIMLAYQCIIYQRTGKMPVEFRCPMMEQRERLQDKRKQDNMMRQRMMQQ